MKKIVALVVLLALLVACKPEEVPRPVMQPPSVPVAQPPGQAPPPGEVPPAAPPPPVVQPPVAPPPAQAPPDAPADSQSAPKTVNVDIKEFKYQPETVTIKVGDTVVWTQVDEVKHTVTIVTGPESFDSGLLSAGKTFSYTFTKPGTYAYKCTPHPGMRGTVTVE